ncbi:2-C-methyl-D-erythritol 2,4-cyclodiphosphate synthase [Puniceicoccus vermicola]|uniref:2-C-methyl-D-erythritol 2,4-cyclodiphosphate synthase n=1 Tax=Puniceicoccus vermicola TaxID=388746 RepID=A0A7X1AV63_9BACT|nr:2-C-methyl-D-erythritol 2,4-cyclodiphosphate synthase [Puniceicoccus vermicola]MBC2600608.1 2-C-methyl-D-erythritol 2,4-cyclodiphosphate synthase [Puniceicoccus vermicola]
MSLPPFRTGLAYDVHRFAPERPLVLGGVTIPDAPGLDGHSDADCLTHAASDAILGALALPDIGFHFPPGDPSCLNIDSQKILAFAAEKAAELGYKIGNLDVMIIAEKPKISPWTGKMRERLAATLGIGTDQVGIKATTNEGLGSIGRGEGISAMATVLLYRE